MAPTPPSPDSKREALLEAAIWCVVFQGFQTTTAQVAQQAHVATGSLFRYFATKDLLLHAAARYAHDVLCAELVPGPAFPSDTVYDGVRRVWQALSQRALRKPLLFHFQVLYALTPGYGARDSVLVPRLNPWRKVGAMLVESAGVTQQEANWLAPLLELQWVNAMQLLLASGEQDLTHPWGGELAADIFHLWWAGVGVSRTHPMGS